MGKSRKTTGAGAAARSRQATVSAQIQDVLAGPATRIQGRSDEALFVVDKVGSKAKRRREEEVEEKGSKSVNEENKIKRMIANKLEATKVHERQQLGGPKRAKVIVDAWAEGNDNLKVSARGRTGTLPKGRSTKKTQPAHYTPTSASALRVVENSTGPKVHAFQSYNPSVDDYKKGVATILTKQEAIQALNDARRHVELVKTELGDAEEASDNEEEAEAVLQDEIMSDDDDDEETKTKGKATQVEKLTRAQRNKIQRKKEVEAELVAHRARKQLRKDMNQSQVIAKELERQLAEQDKAKLERDEAKQTKFAGKVDLSDRRLPSILLPMELSASLRKMRTAGGLLKDQIVTLQSKNIVEKPPTKKRYAGRKNRRSKKTVDRSSGFPAHMKRW